MVKYTTEIWSEISVVNMKVQLYVLPEHIVHRMHRSNLQRWMM